MEYNEPLNLSIKKKPIAVVTPSSSNKVDIGGSSGSISNDADDPSEHLDTSSPSGVNESDNMNQSSPPVPNTDDTNACIDSISVCVNLCFIMTLSKMCDNDDHRHHRIH